MSCWQIAWRLTHSATCCPFPSSPSSAALHILCASTSASHQVHCVPNGLRVRRRRQYLPPPLSHLLPLANSLQFLHLQLPHTHTHSAHTVGIVCFMALLHCPHSPGKFCLAAAATLLLLLLLLQLPLLPLDFVIEI